MWALSLHIYIYHEDKSSYNGIMGLWDYGIMGWWDYGMMGWIIVKINEAKIIK